MPQTPNFAIDYPCTGAQISLSDFSMLALDTEAAISAVNAEAAAVTNGQHAYINLSSANPPVGVETIFTFSTSTSNGMTLNAGAGTVTPTTSGICVMSITHFGNAQSSLTLTSSRIAIYNNNVFFAARKWPGSNPTGIGTYAGAFEIPVPVLAGDTITFRYLWTGTGTIAGGGGTSAVAWLSMIASP